MFIVASINLNNFSEEKIRKTVLIGADVLRFNFGYEMTEEKINNLKIVAEMIDDLHSSTKIMADLPTNSARLGDFYSKYFRIKENEDLILKSSNYSADCNEYIPVQLNQIGLKVEKHQNIILGNGEVIIEVVEILDENTVKVRALNNGTIQSIRSLNIQVDDETYLKNLTEKTAVFDIVEPGFIALPYLKAELNEKIKQVKNINRNGKKIIIKIGDQNAIEHLEEICRDPFYDIIMLDRGKLGNSMPYEKIGILQKQIIRKIKSLGKPVIISTQILESTIHNSIPSKSDVVDLTEIILEKADGIVVCKETDPNQRPAYTIAVAKKIINEVKKSII